jgi:hypothetical protein
LFDFYVFILDFELKLSALRNPDLSLQDDISSNSLSADDLFANVLTDDNVGLNVGMSSVALYIFLSLGIPFLIAAGGFAYYVKASRSQKMRLESLDSQSQSLSSVAESVAV